MQIMQAYKTFCSKRDIAIYRNTPKEQKERKPQKTVLSSGPFIIIVCDVSLNNNILKMPKKDRAPRIIITK